VTEVFISLRSIMGPMARDRSCRSIDELCDLSRGTVRRWTLSLDHESRSPRRVESDRTERAIQLDVFAGTAECVRKHEDGRPRTPDATDCL
jgi:hypothetical protein